MVNSKLRWTMLKSALLGATCLMGVSANAQEVKNDKTSGSETVVVTGFKRAYADAVRSKRNSVEITDGISSDGLGRFPDLNVGEALQRVPGVQINREAEGRNATINLRGLPGEYARLTMNGQAFAEPILGDSAPLGAFNSDIFSAIVVEKSPMANAQTGGLSGNIDLQIASALSRKEGGFAKLSYEHNALGSLGSPAGTIGYNKRFGDKFAAFGVLAYKKENFRRDSIMLNNYSVLSPNNTDNFAANFGQYYAAPGTCTSAINFCSAAVGGTGTTSKAGVLFNSQTRQYTRLNEGDTVSGAGGFEYRINENAKIGVTAFYTDREQPDTRQDLMIIGLNNGSRVTPLSAPEALADGRFVVHNISFSNPDATMSTRKFAQHQASQGFNVNGEWKNDDWTLSAVGHFSNGTNASEEVQVDFITIIPSAAGVTNGITGTLNTGGGDISNFFYSLSPSPATSVNAPNGWFWGGAGDPTSIYDASATADRRRRMQFTGTQSYADNETSALQFDAERNVNFGIISSIKSGIRFEHNQFESRGYRIMAFGLQTQNINSSHIVQSPYASDFFGGKGGTPTSNWQIANLDILSAVKPVTVFPGGQLAPVGFNIRYSDNNYSLFNFTNTTDLTEFYTQAKYDHTLNGIRLRGNLGLRYEKAENTIDAFDRRSLTGAVGSPADFVERQYKQSYDNLLPSFILKADLSDKLVLRAAAYKTYVRPHPRQYSPVTIVGNPSISSSRTDVAVTLGNTNLKPYKADSFDMSLEWYNRANGLVSIAAFQKTIKGIISAVSDRSEICPANGANWNVGTLTWDSGQSICLSSLGTVASPYVVSVSGVKNYDSPIKVTGLEFNAQQNLDFLPAPFDKLGGSFNYAYTDISGNLGSGVKATLPGVSKHNMNFISYYETPKYGVRLVYNYRTEYDLASAGTFTGAARSVEPRGQIDMSASYNLNDRVTLSFDAYNLTDSIRVEYENQENLPRRADYDGRTYTFTVRTTF